MKGVCSLILADWSNQALTREKLVKMINLQFQKEQIAGYAEVVGTNFTVHSERASAMRFHMVTANERLVSMQRRAGIATFFYTNDADQNFAYDVRSGKDVSAGLKTPATPPTPTPAAIPAQVVVPPPHQSSYRQPTRWEQPWLSHSGVDGLFKLCRS